MTARFSLALLIGFMIAGGSQAAPPDTKFDKVGPQVGEQVPNLNMRSTKGEVQRLSDAWKGGPALLVTSSLTCPKSRSRWPELKAIADKYGDQVNVVIVYVIEAHPVGSICPYKGVEDITPENERDGILRKQPATLEDRIELAQEFKRLLRIGIPIYIDDVKNEAWKGLGAAPNLALLVDDHGTVAARLGWFEGKSTEEAIEKYLAANKDQPKRGDDDRMTRKEEAAHQRVLEKADLEDFHFRRALRDVKELKKLEQAIKKTPQLLTVVFSIQQGHAYETTPLMEAVLERNLPAVELLLAHGADVKARTHSYESALQIAADQGELKIVQTLLKHKADPNLPRTGRSPLHEAALAGHVDVAKALVAAGAQADLYSEIALGNIAAVRDRLKEDPSRALCPDGAGRTPLDYAAANGQQEIAKLLLDAGAPVVSEKHIAMDPPLHRAIEHAQVAMVKLLLEAGSSPDTMVGYGGEYSNWTPALHLAIAKKNVEIVKLLLAHKVDLTARNTYSKTPMHQAATYGETEIVKLLARAGADVNALQLGYSLPCGSPEDEKPSNNTPLHFAASNGNLETVQALLAAGAKPLAENAKGQTPLSMATSRLQHEPDDKDLPKVIALLRNQATGKKPTVPAPKKPIAPAPKKPAAPARK